jgi:PKD repeat protein
MATYKTDRDRNYGFVGKFKFNYTVRFDDQGAIIDFGRVSVLAGAYIIFRQGLEFTAEISIGRAFPGSVADSISDGGGFNWFGETADRFKLTIPIYKLGDNFGNKIPLLFKLKGTGVDLRGSFILDVQPPKDENIDSFFNIGGSNINNLGKRYYRDISGTVEGYIYKGNPLLEMVEILEHYPLKENRVPNTCQTTNQVWNPEELTEKTVRQWPKYTTLNWFETIDFSKKARVGIYIIHTKSNGQTSRFSKFQDYAPDSFERVFYGVSKTAYAWQSLDRSGASIPTSGYIKVGGNVNYTDYTIPPLVSPNGTVTEDTWDLKSDSNWKGKAKISLYQEPSRNVTFDSQIYNWDKPYTDYLKGYIAGFKSEGKREEKNFECKNKKIVIPTFETVETRSGKISGSQTYVTYTVEEIFLTADNRTTREQILLSSPIIDFSNQQKWIFGAIDRRTAPEEFDTLLSPTKYMDYPEKFVRLTCGCQDINEESRFRTLDFDEDFFGCAPIPLRGWKFNAMTLKQNQTLKIPGESNSRTFTGDTNNPKYYGDLNLSGFRYLKIKARSKNNDSQSANLQIFEIAKGPKQNQNTIVENEKSFLVNTNSDKFSSLTIDLCNPDNKIDFVDNQDSPYPRLNTYTTSVPSVSYNLGFLSAENKPKDDFLITKPALDRESDNWINDDIKKSISNSGFVYISNDSDATIDYFEVDPRRFPKAGVGTNIIFGRPRIINGKIKLAKYWNPQEIGNDPDYRKTLYLYVPKNDLTKDKTIYKLLNQSEDKTFPDEFEIFDYAYNFPDITDVVARVTSKFVDGNNTIFITNISAYDKNQDLPYDAIQVENTQGITKKYKIFDYVNSVDFSSAYFTLQTTGQFDQNLIFNVNASIKLTFFDQTTDDTFNSIVVKFAKVERFNDVYKATLEYAKYDKNSEPNFDGIPITTTNGRENIFSNNAPVITVNPVRLNEYIFPKDSLLRTRISPSNTGNEVTAIDDYPQDEVQNGPFYGISRVTKINLENSLMELGDIELYRQNSLANFVISGDQNTFEAKTKFIAAENANTSGVPTETQYYTRRFWQQNTDGRDEEEGDINWQFTSTASVSFWTLFPKTISELCDDINKVDYYVAPRWLNPNNPYSAITRHPGWMATKVDKSFPTDPVTGERIYGNLLDPDYLNSDSGYASWLYGGGVLAIPSGKNSGSGTSYITSIDVNFNEVKSILAQTIFHRINADFPPGKPDLFGNSSLRNEDGTVQESTLHLRGGFIARGPGYGLILPPKKSTAEDVRKANLIEVSTNTNKGSSESDSKGYFQTSSPFGKNKIDHYIELEKSKNFTTPSSYRSSTRKFAQAKRERAAYKGGKQNVATNLSACESGFEKSIVIAYTVPTTKPGEENQTAIITTDSFFTQQYEKYPVGYNTITGTGVTIKGEFPFVLGSETHINQTSRVNAFLFTEKNSSKTATNSHYYESLIAANTDMRNKLSWFPFIDGEAKTDANFSTLSKAFTGTKYNSYAVSDQAPQLFNVGYADPGAIVFRSVSLNTTSINAPITDKTIFIDGVAPTYISDFRLLEPISSSGTAYSSFPTVSQISSREYIVAYSLNSNPRQINFKIISDYQALDKNVLFDLDALTGNTLSDKYNIYGLTSDYDEKLNLHRSIFWCNGGIYYFEYNLSSKVLGAKRSDKLHLIKGKLDEALVTELINRSNIVTYYDSQSELNAEVPKQKPALISCKKQDYNGKVLVAYDSGKCYIEAVLFDPYADILGTRKFDIECVNTPDSTVKDSTPVADIQANPISGQSALLVNFLSTNSYDPGGSTLTYAWNFGDETQSTEENPVHTFVNNTTDPIQFKVTLIVTNTNGISSDSASIVITVNPAPVNNLLPQAKFSATPTSGDVTLTVTFTDQSTPANDNSFLQIYEWDFGDGNTSIKFDNASFTYDYTRSGTFVPSLKVKDNLERISVKFVGPTINVNGVSNNPPAPGFRSAQTSFAPTLKVQFTDTSSDDEGPIVAWNWKFGDDQTADVQNPEHIYASPGKYLVMLTVTDSGGLQASGSKEITVLPPGNNPPIANFSYSQQNRKLVIDFTDTSTDSDGAITTWNWDFGDNSFDTIQNPSHSYLSSGNYQVSVTVTDNGGKTTSITKNVVVNPLVNQSPIISNVTGIQTSFKPLVGKFTEVSSDPDGFITNWDWNFGDGSAFSTTDSTLKNPTHTYLFPGIYTVSLIVTDDGLPDGTNKKTTTSSIQFTVSPPPANQPPIALFTVDTNNVFAPVVINFTDASTDADGRIVSWLWEFETGRSVFYNAQTYQKTVAYTFNKSGTYPVKLTVRDDGNLSNTYVLDIVIKNNVPVPILSASPNPVLSQTLVSFFGNNSYDSDGNITKYAWDFGDGTVIVQGTTFESHTYSKPGTYKSSLTVTDNIGDSSTANLLITVTNRNPVARITYTSLNVKAPGSLTLNGDTSSDQDGIIVSYNWTVSNGLSASTPNATFNFTTEGTYTVTLLVTDDSGGTNSTSVIVTVTPPDNVLPIAILVTDKNSGVINDTFIFNSSSSYDPDGNIILYKLDFGDGTTTQFVTPALVSHIYKSIGVFTAKLSVIDNRNGISVETLNSVQKIIINNQPPIANFTFGPNNAFTFDPVTFTDTSTDPDNAINKWVWNFGDGTTFTTTDPLQKSPQKSYDKGNKDYVVSLTVYDNLGLFSTVTQTVRINNRKPFAVISTNKTANNNTIVGIAPFTVVFDSNSYDLDGSVVNYEWYLNGISGTPITTKSFTYTFINARFTPYVVTLRVQDDDGEFSDLAYIGVKVNAPNIPPVAVIRANPASRTRQAPVTVDFSGAGSYDPDNVDGPLIYSWDFGNGSFSDQINASTVYSQPGTYKVSLTVTDNLAATNTATLDYIVLNNKPVALLDTVPSGIVAVKLNTPIVFTSSGSFDTDINQFINGYKWLKDGVNQNSNTPTFETSFDSVGNHTITLSVFDNLGLESDLVNKTVFVFDDPIPPPNQNPIAILGNEPSVSGYVELKVGDSFTFNGANSYDVEDGFNITYEWSIDGVKSGFTSTFTNQFNTAGIFTISLVVFDTKKLSSTTATNLGNRNEIQVNVSAVSNPLTNKLFSSGQALYGAIASGSNTPDRYGFQLVDDTKQYTVIESGLYHTFVIDVDGKLYASGSNSNGQLGFSSNITQQNSLTLVPLASKYKVVKVSAGDLCSAIIAQDTTTSKRVLLVCGSNINGIFGQALPRTNIYNFQPILERSSADSGVSYSSNNGLLDVSCNSYILAFTDNRQVWVSGKHNYINKTGITDTGFFPINIDPNPDIYVGSKNYLNPFKLEVGFNNFSGFVTGLSYDIDSQIVWFTGLSSIRGWGYAYDISTYENTIVIISASTDPYWDYAIVLYNFASNEIPSYDFSPGLSSDLNPDSRYIKISASKFGFLSIAENVINQKNTFYAYGDNSYGALGIAKFYTNSRAYNLQNGLSEFALLMNTSVVEATDIAAGGNHSIILASNVKPSSYSFTIIRPDGYALDPQYPTIYPTTQAAG